MLLMIALSISGMFIKGGMMFELPRIRKGPNRWAVPVGWFSKGCIVPYAAYRELNALYSSTMRRLASLVSVGGAGLYAVEYFHSHHGLPAYAVVLTVAGFMCSIIRVILRYLSHWRKAVEGFDVVDLECFSFSYLVRKEVNAEAWGDTFGHLISFVLFVLLTLFVAGKEWSLFSGILFSFLVLIDFIMVCGFLAFVWFRFIEPVLKKNQKNQKDTHID